MDVSCALSAKQIIAGVVLLWFFCTMSGFLIFFMTRTRYAGKAIEIGSDQSYLDELFPKGEYEVRVIDRETRLITIHSEKNGTRLCILTEKAPSVLFAHGYVKYQRPDDPEMGVSKWVSVSKRA